VVEAVFFPRVVDRPNITVGARARRAVAAADPAAATAKAEQGLGGRFVFAGPGAVAGLIRFEAEVAAGRVPEVWAAIDGHAATVDQAGADAFVDLLLANAAVSTVVDLALPAGFASLALPGRAPAVPAARDWRWGLAGVPVPTGRLVVEEAAIGVLVDADQHSTDQHSTDQHSTDQHSTDQHSTGAVVRLLAGLPAVRVLDQRAGTLTREMIEQIVFDPDTVSCRLVIDPGTGWVVDAGATAYHPGRAPGPDRAQEGPALPLPGLRHPGPVLRPGPRRPLPARPHRADQPGLPVPAPPPQDPRPLVAEHDRGRCLHLGRPAHRGGPHHRTRRLPRARSLNPLVV